MLDLEKLLFHSKSYLSRLVPQSYYRAQLQNFINSPRATSIEERLDYYFKAPKSFTLNNPVSLATFRNKGKSAYKADLFNILKYFDPQLPFQHYFGDSLNYPDVPTFIKARPIPTGLSNSVLLRLNSIRHFKFIDDPIPFHKKKGTALWRGSVNNSLRENLLQTYQSHPMCDFQSAHRRSKKNSAAKYSMTHHEQLKHKFLISIEGNDVATNTKWIMNSNSLCFMPKPTKETWFMEGTLKPGFHYVQLRNDFSNLEEKIDHYNSHPEEALEIINNAQSYTKPFKDMVQERLLGVLVAQRYFDAVNKDF